MSDAKPLTISDRLRAMREKPEPDYEHDVWYCKVGETTRAVLNKAMGPSHGADGPMRDAIREAFHALTGKWPDFIFSGWGQRLTESEQAVVYDREPEYEKTGWATLTQAAEQIDTQKAIGERFRDFLHIPRSVKDPCDLCGCPANFAIHDQKFGGTHAYTHAFEMPNESNNPEGDYA